MAVLAVAAVVAGPWYVRQTVEYSNPVAFNRPAPDVPLWRRRPLVFYAGLGLPKVFEDPARPNFVNQFVPTVYSDLWGDYFGYFSWTTTASGVGPVALTPTGRRQLQTQSILGVIPTLLAFGGAIGLLRLALKSRTPHLQPGLLAVALLPFVGLLAFLAFTVAYPSGDGDVLKAGYLLTTLPSWAIGFGYGWACALRTRIAALAALACVLALASDMVFLLHRGPLGPL